VAPLSNYNWSRIIDLLNYVRDRLFIRCFTDMANKLSVHLILVVACLCQVENCGPTVKAKIHYTSFRVTSWRGLAKVRRVVPLQRLVANLSATRYTKSVQCLSIKYHNNEPLYLEIKTGPLSNCTLKNDVGCRPYISVILHYPQRLRESDGETCVMDFGQYSAELASTWRQLQLPTAQLAVHTQSVQSGPWSSVHQTKASSTLVWTLVLCTCVLRASTTVRHSECTAHCTSVHPVASCINTNS